MAHALFKVNGKQFASLNLNKSLVIGRALDCHICVRDSKLSRWHVRLEKGDDGWFAIDLKSSNGTLVEGERIERHRLEDGDLIEAHPLSIVFHAVRPPAAEASDFTKQIVIDPVDLAIEEQLKGAPAPMLEKSPEASAAKARKSVEEAINQREQEWAALANVTQNAPSHRKPLSQLLDRLPKPIGLTLVGLTGLALFFVTFELSNWIAR
jgi:hypothetical protein